MRAAGIPLTINAVVHRQNVDNLEAIIELAVACGAKRLEVAHVQYYGWALVNRAALMPTREQTERSVAVVEAAKERLKGVLAFDYVVPDYYARYPKPCMGGWAKQNLNVTPSGKVLPCHAAETITTLEFDNVKDRPLAEIWYEGAAFNAFRGTDWMAEPCRSCPAQDRGLRRLPLPGVRADRRRDRDRSGLLAVAAAPRSGRDRRARGARHAARLHLSQAAEQPEGRARGQVTVTRPIARDPRTAPGAKQRRLLTACATPRYSGAVFDPVAA